MPVCMRNRVCHTSKGCTGDFKFGRMNEYRLIHGLKIKYKKHDRVHEQFNAPFRKSITLREQIQIPT